MSENLSYRAIRREDLSVICEMPQSAEELFYMFPKAEYPLTIDQMELALESRFDPTVILYESEIVGFANFYEVEKSHHCSIGNVVVNSNFRNMGIGEYLISTMEDMGLEKYKVEEFHISCFSTNIKGILLYTKLGYRPFEIEKRIDKENGIQALIKLKKEIKT